MRNFLPSPFCSFSWAGGIHWASFGQRDQHGQMSCPSRYRGTFSSNSQTGAQTALCLSRESTFQLLPRHLWKCTILLKRSMGLKLLQSMPRKSGLANLWRTWSLLTSVCWWQLQALSWVCTAARSWTETDPWTSSTSHTLVLSLSCCRGRFKACIRIKCLIKSPSFL